MLSADATPAMLIAVQSPKVNHANCRKQGKMKRADLAVIAPCYNEAQNIDKLVDRVEKSLAEFEGRYELILIDDASSDDTWGKIQSAAKDKPWIIIARHFKNRGIVEGWRSGLAASTAGRLVTIDADMQYRPEDITKLVAAMDESGAAFVQGWRETQVDRGALRYGLTQSFSYFLNVMFKMNLKDNKSGFVCYTREAMTEVLGFRRPFKYFQHFIAIAAHALRLKIVQVPVVFDQREAGMSFITSPIRFSIEALTDIPRALLEFRIAPRKLDS
jgi:glycosyltransferase involved in cell wall biosynthesis